MDGVPEMIREIQVEGTLMARSLSLYMIRFASILNPSALKEVEVRVACDPWRDLLPRRTHHRKRRSSDALATGDQPAIAPSRWVPTFISLK